MELFRDRNLAVATKHAKEKVIKPILEQQLKAKVFVPENFDTDIFGTFSGEIERKLSPLDAAREKCNLALKLTNGDLAVASEGSFGPHPTFPFINADEEIVLLIDKVNNLEIWGREISTDTNFNASYVDTFEELKKFAEEAVFPSHGLIIKASQHELRGMAKDIATWEQLSAAYEKLRRENSSVYVETDMRAMHNPTRMKVIENATERLIDKINSICPSCNTPGFSVNSVTVGLPCSLCSSPTRSILAEIFICNHCGYKQEKHFPQGKKEEDPMYCDYCNP